MQTKVLRSAIETHPIIFRVLSHDSTLVCSIAGTIYVMNFFFRSRKDFNDKNKKASYWDKIGQKIHLSAEEAEAKFLQHKNCIRSLSNPKPMLSQPRFQGLSSSRPSESGKKRDPGNEVDVFDGFGAGDDSLNHGKQKK